MLNLESVVEFFRWLVGANQAEQIRIPVRVEREEDWRRRRSD